MAPRKIRRRYERTISQGNKGGIQHTSKQSIDRKLLFLTLLLTFLGVIAIADASAPLAVKNYSDKFYFARQQLVWAIAGFTLMFIVSKIHYSFWAKVATPFFFASVAGLFLVFIPGLGINVLGATRWLNLGPYSFQPSELVKLSISVYLARVYSKDMTISSYFIPLIVVAALIMLQPDLGTTSIIVGLSMAQIFASGINLVKFMGAGILGLMGTFLLILTSSYRRERLMTFLKISHDPLDEGYHIRQILLALGSGGIWGVGLGQSRQKFLFLPETATDSIFAVIAEEIGFVGSLFFILIFVALVLRGIYIAKHAPDKFSFLLACGITSWIGVQTFLNIASMVALVPLTGIPLPFISYGGSSLVITLIAVGILLNISKYAKARN